MFLTFQMNIAHKIYLGWQDLMNNKSDPRTTNWFLMSSPLPTILICLSYVYIVKVSFFFCLLFILSSLFFLFSSGKKDSKSTALFSHSFINECVFFKTIISMKFCRRCRKYICMSSMSIAC